MTTLDAGVRELFDGPNYAHLATVLPDGSPHSVPLWVAMEGDLIAVQTSPGSRKARNIEHDPRVAISITDRERPLTMAQVRGRVTERLEGERAWALVDRIAHKYLGVPYPERTGRVVYLIEPEHVTAIAF